MIVRWPHEEDLRRTLRAAGVPRLLLIDPHWDPPRPMDPLEDWVATSADPDEVRHRLANLAARAGRAWDGPPVLETGDILRFRGRWIALAPSEVDILRRLVEDFDQCVPRAALGVDELDKAGQATLHTHVHRIRRRIEPLGLVIETVRGRGLILGVRHCGEVFGGSLPSEVSSLG